MRELIARVFTYALDGSAEAESGTRYMEFCRGKWESTDSVLGPTT